MAILYIVAYDIFWIGFLALVGVMLALDLCLLNKKDHEIGVGEALKWTGVWIFLALLFGGFIFFAYEHHLLGIGVHAGASLSGVDAFVEYLWDMFSKSRYPWTTSL